MSFRCLILDLDGTIVDSHRYTFAAFRHACAPFRLEPEDAEIYAAFGPYERAILAQLLPTSQVDSAYVRLQAYYREHVTTLAVHPAMPALLDDCRAAGVRCGLFTGRGSDSTQMILARLDLARAFDAVVAGDDVERPKPSGDGVRRLLATLDCQPGEAIVVGDSRLDLEAALDAGTAAAVATWYVWSRTPPMEAAALLLQHPDELRPHLGLAPAAAAADNDEDNP